MKMVSIIYCYTSYYRAAGPKYCIYYALIKSSSILITCPHAIQLKKVCSSDNNIIGMSYSIVIPSRRPYSIVIHGWSHPAAAIYHYSLCLNWVSTIPSSSTEDHHRFKALYPYLFCLPPPLWLGCLAALL